MRRPLLLLNAFVLLGSLLLFGMEPLVGRLLLPSFGGSFHVWATCLMVFQGALFLGYLYCHLLAPQLGRAHLAVILIPLAFLPIGRGLWEAEPDPSAPVASILSVLGWSIVVPFTIVATTGVIAQRWLAESALPERTEPYRLYAASNAGSLIALLGYPFLIEPFLGLQTQRWMWSAAYLGYAVLAVLASRLPRSPHELPGGTPRAAQASPPAVSVPAAKPPTAGDWLAWGLLSAAPSACLMAVTNVLAMDLGSIPLLWVVPLALYLLTFVLIFSERSVTLPFLQRHWPELSAAGLLVWLAEDYLTWGSALLLLVVLFAVCMAGHAELHRRRPAPHYLTGYYLILSLGGWLGGVFVSLAAPVLFDSLAEFPVSIGVLAVTLLVLRRRILARQLRDRRARVRVALTVGILGLLASQAASGLLIRMRLAPNVVRDFYGIYRIYDVTQTRPPGPPVKIRQLHHGSTVHGKELRDPSRYGVPIGYFHAASPLGEVLRLAHRPLDLAIVGLGSGALAGHLKAGDRVTYYELDPLVEELARKHFHYLETTPAAVDVIPGDARLKLRSAPDAAYDMVLVDAFSSDAIPIHLLTREALELYRRKVRPGGLLVFHISGRYYDLRPVLQATGAVLDPPLVGAFSRHPERGLEDASTAFVLAPNREALRPLLGLGWTPAAEAKLPKLAPWTDDYANLLAALWAKQVSDRAGR